MKDFIEYFISYITIEESAALFIIQWYRADLNRSQNFLKTNLNISDFSCIEAKHIKNYLSNLKNSYNYRTSSIANKVNTIKHFFNFLHKASYIKDNPTNLLKDLKLYLKVISQEDIKIHSWIFDIKEKIISLSKNVKSILLKNISGNTGISDDLIDIDEDDDVPF